MNDRHWDKQKLTDADAVSDTLHSATDLLRSRGTDEAPEGTTSVIAHESILSP